MEIYCKCAIIDEEMNTCKGLKCNGIEIQLLNDFITDYRSSSYYVTELGEQLKDIKIVHSPLNCGDAIDIEDLVYSETFNVFMHVCELAEEIGKKNNSIIGVIVHTGMNMTDLSANEYLRKYLVNAFKSALESYPHIKLYIENVICISNGNVGNLHFRNGALPTYLDVIKYFRKELGNGKEHTEDYYSNRVSGVLDICHALTSIKMLRGCGIYTELEDYFAMVYDDNRNIGLIHLAFVNNLGLNKDEHAIGYTEDTYNELEFVMKLYRKYNFNCPITIEVNEEDYTQYSNYKKTRELLDKLL